MKKRIMVVDDNKSIVLLMKEYFEGNKDFEIKYVANDGEEAVKIIEKEYDNIDCVLLDLIMPKKDGIYVLQKIREMKLKLNVIVETSYNEEETIRKVSELGARYFILKPYELKDIEDKVREVTSENKKESRIINLHENNIQTHVTTILHELGIPSHIKGYNYIRDAITMVYDKPSLIGGITKELYPELAKKYDSNVTRVERAIRHAIEVSWCRGDWDLMEEIFGHSVDIDKAKPTNSEFIVTIADKLKLDLIKTR